LRWKNPEALGGNCQLVLDLGQVPTSLDLVGWLNEEPLPALLQRLEEKHKIEMAGEKTYHVYAFHQLPPPPFKESFMASFSFKFIYFIYMSTL
jgi:hypothetical protein